MYIPAQPHPFASADSFIGAVTELDLAPAQSPSPPSSPNKPKVEETKQDVTAVATRLLSSLSTRVPNSPESGPAAASNKPRFEEKKQDVIAVATRLWSSLSIRVPNRSESGPAAASNKPRVEEKKQDVTAVADELLPIETSSHFGSGENIPAESPIRAPCRRLLPPRTPTDESSSPFFPDFSPILTENATPPQNPWEQQSYVVFGFGGDEGPLDRRIDVLLPEDVDERNLEAGSFSKPPGAPKRDRDSERGGFDKGASIRQTAIRPKLFS